MSSSPLSIRRPEDPFVCQDYATPLAEEEKTGAASGGGSSDALIADERPRGVLDPISGIPAYTPEEQITFNSWKGAIQRSYERFGFSAFEAPPVVTNSALRLKGGISHEMYGVYRLNGKLDAGFGLPFDRTVPMAMYAASNFSRITFPWARYDIANSFRAEQAAPGRFRAFYQCDVDILNRDPITAMQEADCIAAITSALQTIEIPEFTLCINHLVIVKILLQQIGVPEDQIAPIFKVIDKIEKIGKEAVIHEIQEVYSEIDLTKLEALLTQLQESTDPFSFENPLPGNDAMEEAITHLTDLIRHLESQGISRENMTLRLDMVRGLDYYTGIVFETFINGKENLGSIASGGSYDNLVEAFNPRAKVFGFGGAIGLTRLFHVMKEINALNELKRKVTHDITVVLQDPSQLENFSEISGRLRKEGYRVFCLSNKALSNQLKTVGKWNCPYAVIVKASGGYSLKTMRDGLQEDCPSSSELLAALAAKGLPRI